jgi:hypothetical protein
MSRLVSRPSIMEKTRKKYLPVIIEEEPIDFTIGIKDD